MVNIAFKDVPYRRWRKQPGGKLALVQTRVGQRVMRHMDAYLRSGNAVDFFHSKPLETPPRNGAVYDTISITIKD